ncbi:hypothetical protein ACWCIB_11570 [SAR92 clade bacterium H246]|jgi:hypothetical protein
MAAIKNNLNTTTDVSPNTPVLIGFGQVVKREIGSAEQVLSLAELLVSLK